MCAFVKNAVEEHGIMSGSDEPGMADVKLVANVTMQIAYRNKDRLSAGMIIWLVSGADRRFEQLSSIFFYRRESSTQGMQIR